MDILKREYDFYMDHRAALLEQHNGKVLVIMGGVVIGVYESESEALEETARSHEIGTFLIQECNPTAESQTQHYHSRVMFSR